MEKLYTYPFDPVFPFVLLAVKSYRIFLKQNESCFIWETFVLN